MAPSIYFNREASQKCKNTKLQNNLKGVLFPGGSTYLIVNNQY